MKRDRRRSDTSSPDEDLGSPPKSDKHEAVTSENLNLSYPPFRGPQWKVEKLLAQRTCHMPNSTGEPQLEFFTKWMGLDL